VVSDLIPGGYDDLVNAARTLRRARLDAGLTLRALAERAGTSHATLAAYEAGRAVPRVDTLDRVLRAAGYATDIDVARRPDATDAERSAKGQELLDALELAAMFPARHSRRLRFPRFARQRVA
jgi:transcriptional regulator with XRE-family HTH domain